MSPRFHVIRPEIRLAERFLMLHHDRIRHVILGGMPLGRQPTESRQIRALVATGPGTRGRRHRLVVSFEWGSSGLGRLGLRGHSCHAVTGAVVVTQSSCRGLSRSLRPLASGALRVFTGSWPCA